MSTIIIIDDQAVNRAIYEKIALSIDVDIQVKTFSDPRKAFDALAEIEPDLIVTDYKMPGLNGAQFVRLVRAEPAFAEIPIIVITVLEDKQFRLRALDAGATDFLLSPVDRREFVTRARNLLKLRKQQQLLADRAERLERKLEQSKRSLRNAVRDSSERLAQVIDAIPAAISATDEQGRFLFMNAHQAASLGVDTTGVAGRDCADVLGSGRGARSRALDQFVLRGETANHCFEDEITDDAGQSRVLLTTKSPLRNASNQVIGVVTSSLDITDRKAAERHLQHIAHHDALTGLPNRVYLCELLNREITRASRGNRRFALHLIDLDGFKSINDVMGHSVGDTFLTGAAARLLAIKRDDYRVARLGGDEFAILQTGLADNEAAAGFAAEVGAVLREPIVLEGRPTVVGASIGTAIYPCDADNVEELLRCADLAMYKAKRDGGDRHEFYAAEMMLRACQSAQLDAELRLAIEREEFVLHYQPQVCLKSGDVTGVEALIRWRRSDGQLVSPAGFLARAEENGSILAISEWVLRTACKQAAVWRRRGFPSLRMGVNLSPVQFRGQGLPFIVARVLGEAGLDPSLLELELTESILVSDVEQAIIQLQQLRELGVVISFDDFGTGFSSLSYVKRLPVDRLKIDQCFIRNVISDPSDRAIIATVINLAHSLRMKVVAEGVETVEQLEYIRRAGCDAAQGYYLGRPMPAARFNDFMLERRIGAAATVG